MHRQTDRKTDKKKLITITLSYRRALIKSYKLPDYKGARIEVPSGLNIPAWHNLLKGYDLEILAEYLQYVFF